MADLISMLAAAAGAAAGGGEVDPNFNQTVLLLHGDGSDGAQNNTFLDSSTNNFTITRNGNTTQGTFSPFSAPDGRWSNYFDGSGDYLKAADNAAFDLSSGDWTIEGWFYMNSVPSAAMVVGNADRSFGTGGFGVVITSTNLRLVGNSNSQGICTVTWQANTWYHFAIIRSGTGVNSSSIYLNGVKLTPTGNGAGDPTFASTTVGPYIGSDNGPGDYFPGYISNIRIIKGSSAYGANPASITVPTSPLTAVSGTSLLTCQSNRFVDNSSNTFAITVNGNPKVTPFSPFAPSAAYDASVNGGSGYFDGSTDWLRLDNVLAFGTSDWSFEAWVYPTTFASINYIIDFRPTGTDGAFFLLNIQTTGKFRVYVSSAARIDADNAINLNEWTHVCVQEVSGVMTMYVNGVAQSTTWTNTTNFVTAANRPIIGRAGSGTSGDFNGYMAGMRAVIGGVAYSPPFSTPTAPPTAITNTELLLNFTNAGIFDNTGKNNLETVGNAQIDTTTKKYGTGSMEFDGTGDYLTTPASSDLNLSTGDFTIECWFYYSTTPPSGSGYDYLWAIGASNINGLGLYIQGGVPKIWNNSSVLTTTGSISATTWYHIAVVRSSGTLTVYLDGVSIGSVSLTSNLSGGATSGFNIARWINAPDAEEFNGFIDDLRITKGLARYTTTFTPPDKAFPDL